MTQEEEEVVKAISAGKQDIECWVWDGDKSKAFRAFVFAHGAGTAGSIFCTRPNGLWYEHAVLCSKQGNTEELPHGYSPESLSNNPATWAPFSAINLTLRRFIRKELMLNSEKMTRKELQDYTFRISGRVFEDTWYDSLLEPLSVSIPAEEKKEAENYALSWLQQHQKTYPSRDELWEVIANAYHWDADEPFLLQVFKSFYREGQAVQEDKMKVKKTVSVETKERYEFSTDDIEELIKEKYKLSDQVSFDWNIGERVSLDVTVVSSKEEAAHEDS